MATDTGTDAVAASETDRFIVPLYTVAEAARYLSVPASTFSTWVNGYTRRPDSRREVIGAPIVTASQQRRRSHDPSVPFIGLAEGLVLAAIRRAGVPLQRIRPALARLEAELGLEHVLASRSLYTDGAEVLFDFAEESGDMLAAKSARDLVVVRDGQRVFADVVNAYLHRVEFADDGYAQAIALPQYQVATVVADPRRSFGQPILASGGGKLEDVLGLFQAGESLNAVASEYGLPPEQLEELLRVAILSEQAG